MLSAKVVQLPVGENFPGTETCIAIVRARP